MRILFFGDGVWAVNSLKMLVREGWNLLGVVVRTNPTDPELIKITSHLGLEMFQPGKVNAAEFIDKVRALGPDLNVSVSYDQILRRPIIETAHKGFINFHAGKLPFYRGRNVINWAIINNEKEIGITAHYVDEGIDTGDIILQRSVPIGWRDTYGSMLDKVVKALPGLVLDTVALISEGNFRSRSQKGLQGTYFGRREEGDEWIDWTDSSLNIYNKIRGISRPGPGAVTHMRDERIIIWDAFYERDWPEYIAKSGQVVGQNRDGVMVKTGDSMVLVKEVQTNDRIPETPSWPIGTCLGLDKNIEIFRLQKKVDELTRFISRSNLAEDNL